MFTVQQTVFRLLLLLLGVLYKVRIQATSESNWPVSTSNTKLLGFFPQQSNNKTYNETWIIHCMSMFRAAILLSHQYNMMYQGELIGYEEIVTGEDIMLTIDGTCNKVSASNIIGFVGPAYSREARYLSSFAHRLGIISISYSATSPQLSTIDSQAFFRVVPSDENTALGITLLFERYKWKSSIIMHQNDEFGNDGMESLKQQFSEADIRTRETIRLGMNVTDYQIDWVQILKASYSRIVVLWANEQLTTMVLKQAMEEDLLGSDFVWILTTNMPLTSFTLRERQKLIGILTIEPMRADAIEQPINTTLLNQAYDIWKHYQPETFPGNGNVSDFALFTFDATWSFLLALQKLCTTEQSCLQINNASNCYYRQFSHSEIYYHLMRSTSFLGVSGEIRFSNSTTDRVGHQYYVVRNIQSIDVQNKTIDHKPVLKWDTESSQWAQYRNESDDIVWPSQITKAPADYKLIRGTRLRMAVIEATPFIILKNPAISYSGMTGNYKKIELSEFDGFYKDILVYLQDKMGFVPVVMLAKPTVQYDQLVEGVANDLFDTVMTTITITSRRTALVDLSIALMPSAIRVVIRKSQSNDFDLFFFLAPFSWELWAVIAATIIFTAILLWFLGRTRPKGRNRDVIRHGIFERIHYVLCAMLGRDRNGENRSSAEQVLIYGLHVIQVVLFSLYTATILSFIIANNSTTIVSGIDDIKNGKVAPNRIGI
ncbi:unnamed protein product, partial [Adineta ricciae]